MAKPITIPNTFANATTAIPLSQLDNNYSTITASINDANTYSNYAADSGSANAYVVTLSGVSTAYNAGLRIQFKAANTNSGASTLNVNTQGAKNIFFNGSALSANVIQANAVVDVIYDGTQFQMLSTNGTTPSSYGTVTNVSVSSSNGFAGTVATSNTTPNITISTTITGILNGNGTAISAASAGTDYVRPNTASTFTATQTFNGSSSTLGMVIADAAETTTISATAATGTINYDVTTQSVLFYTTNASANWTVNLRGSSGTSMNTLLATGQSITVAFLVTQGATAYYNTTVQVDGTTTGVTTRWQGGTAPTAGNASGVDVYTYTIVKTNNATFTVFASLTQFK